MKSHYKMKKRPQQINYTLYGNVSGPMVTVLTQINRPIHLMLTHSPLHHMLGILAWLVAKMNVLSPTFTLRFLYDVGVSTEDHRGGLTFNGNACCNILNRAWMGYQLLLGNDDFRDELNVRSLNFMKTFIKNKVCKCRATLHCPVLYCTVL